MVNRIVFTPTALRESNNIIAYLRNNAPYQAAEMFLNSVEKHVTQLESNVTEGRPVPSRKNIRFVRIGKYHRMYYRKQGTTLYVTRFFDTRQDPNKRPY